MKISYDDLVAYLDQSEDWNRISAENDWLIYNGPNDIDGEPVQIALPSSPDFSDIQTHMIIAVGILATIAGIHADTMADRITPSSVKALLDAIKYFDCEPGVYNVHVVAASHRAGYEAYASFRTTSLPAADSVSARGETPEQALARLLAVLKAQWGRCPRCGRRLDGQDQVPPR